MLDAIQRRNIGDIKQHTIDRRVHQRFAARHRRAACSRAASAAVISVKVNHRAEADGKRLPAAVITNAANPAAKQC